MAIDQRKESTDDIETEAPRKGPCFGQRHWLIILGNLGIAVMYCMRVNLSVALIAMVNSTAVKDSKSSKIANESSQCPVTNTSGQPSQFGQDGSFVWSRELQGIILSSFFWGYVILQIPGGFLSQRFGGKRVMLFAVIWTSIFTAVTPVIANTGPYWLIGCRFLEGLVEGVTYPTLQSMIGRWIPPNEISLLVPFVFSGSMVGTILGQLVSGPLCESSWGWPSAFYISAVAGLLWSIPWIFLVTDSPEKNSRISPDELAYITHYLGQGTQEMSNRRGVPWCGILTDRAVWALVLVVGAGNWIFYVLLTCLPQYMSDVLHFTITNNGILSSVPYMFAIPVILISGHISDKVIAKGYMRRIYVRKLHACPGFLAVSACLFIVTLVPCNATFTIILLVVTLCVYNFACVGTGPNPSEVSPEYCGIILGIANTMGTISGILAPYVADYMTPNGTIEEWNNVLYLGSALGIFASVMFGLFASSTSRVWHVVEDVEPIIGQTSEEFIIDEASDLAIN